MSRAPQEMGIVYAGRHLVLICVRKEGIEAKLLGDADEIAAMVLEAFAELEEPPQRGLGQAADTRRLQVQHLGPLYRQGVRRLLRAPCPTAWFLPGITKRCGASSLDVIHPFQLHLSAIDANAVLWFDPLCG